MKCLCSPFDADDCCSLLCASCMAEPPIKKVKLVSICTCISSFKQFMDQCHFSLFISTGWPKQSEEGKFIAYLPLIDIN